MALNRSDSGSSVSSAPCSCVTHRLPGSSSQVTTNGLPDKTEKSMGSSMLDVACVNVTVHACHRLFGDEGNDVSVDAHNEVV
jgi:hypothetical protein